MAAWIPWDRVVVLNCDESVERLRRFRHDWARSRLLSQFECVRVRATPEAEAPRPSWWRPPHTDLPGSADRYWSARRSQMGIVEKALAEGVRHLLVLEDDAYPRAMFDELFPKFFEEMPDDWIGYKLFAIAGREPQPISTHCGRLSRSAPTGGNQALGLSRAGLRAWHDGGWKNVHCLYDLFAEPYAGGRMYAPIPYLFAERNVVSVANGSRPNRSLDPGEEGESHPARHR